MGISQFAIEHDYWPQDCLRFGVAELIGDGSISASVLCDLPPCVSEYPALPFHVVTVPLDVEVYKDFKWDNGSFSGQMRRGDISVIPAGSPSRISYEGRYRESLNLFICPAFLDQIFREQFHDLSLDARKMGGVFRNTWLTELGSRIRSEIAGDQPGRRLIVESLALTFVVTLARLMSGSSAEQIEIRKSDRIAHPHVKRAIVYIHSHLGEDISLSSLAAASGCNVDRLKHAFKDHVGDPPYRYLLRMRIEKARLLLNSSDHEISDIARLCGFNDQSHLTTAFARHVGVTPAKWRMESRNH